MLTRFDAGGRGQQVLESTDQDAKWQNNKLTPEPQEMPTTRKDKRVLSASGEHKKPIYKAL